MSKANTSCTKGWNLHVEVFLSLSCILIPTTSTLISKTFLPCQDYGDHDSRGGEPGFSGAFDSSHFLPSPYAPPQYGATPSQWVTRLVKPEHLEAKGSTWWQKGGEVNQWRRCGGFRRGPGKGMGQGEALLGLDFRFQPHCFYPNEILWGWCERGPGFIVMLFGFDKKWHCTRCPLATSDLAA